MIEPLLVDDQELRSACAASLEAAARAGHRDRWAADIVAFIESFRAASSEERATVEFQRWLWDENPVAAIGQGQISVEAAIAETSVREWLAAELGRHYPEDPVERRLQIVALFDEIRERFFATRERKPWLKLYRVMAVVFPDDFTSIADRRKLKHLHRAMFRSKTPRPLLGHFEIRERIEDVLGPAGQTLEASIERMILPWLLFEYVVLPTDDERTEEPAGRGGETRLVPLPAARRRRGITSLPGHMDTVLAVLDFVSEGTGRQELMGFLKSVLPGYKDSSLNVALG